MDVQSFIEKLLFGKEILQNVKKNRAARQIQTINGILLSDAGNEHLFYCCIYGTCGRHG